MIPGSANPLLLKSAAAAGAYQVERSLRFNSSDSGFCSRTPAVAGDRKKWTWSGWVKRGRLGIDPIFGLSSASISPGLGTEYIRFTSSDTIDWFAFHNGSSWTGRLTTSQVFRDPSAWMHIVYAVDLQNATSTDRLKLYVNGTIVTAFSTAAYPNTTDSTAINAAQLHELGRQSSGDYFDGYLADIHFIDGQALDATAFTEVSATTGQLIPKAYSGTFGTNGFWLKFSDNSAATAATLGKDYSGNNNNWTPNNLSVTAGAGNDSLVDTPTSISATDTGVGGEVRGNYCTWNPLISTSGPISNGNLEMVGANAWRNTKGTISVSTGKWYFEATYTGSQYGSTLGNIAAGVGFCKSNTTTPNVDVSDSSLYGSILAFSQTGHVNNFNAPSSARSQIASGDVIGFALNYDAGTYTIYVNNTSTSSGGLNFTGELTPWTNAYYSGSYFILNTGQRAFAYTAPSGFKALCDTNLPAPLTAKPNTVMDVVLYTGTGAALTPTSSLGFNPDWIWIKSRSAATDHALYDVVRGAQARLESNTTDAEVTTDGGVTAFNSAGFTLGTLAQVNTSSATYAAWCWDAGTSTVSNPDGSITSQVRANVSAGFSVISYTGNGSGGSTIGHGLGVAPAFAIFKNRSTSSDWQVYHVSLGNANSILLQSTAAAGSSSAFNSTSPTSTVITLGAGTSLNNNGSNHICYAWTPAVGYSSMGSYVGNASADGPMVYLGFRPRFVIIKCSSTSNSYTNWDINDSARNTYNAADNTLCANLSDEENSVNIGGQPLDFLANGFKIRQATSSSKNLSGQTYIYCAWAESPFQYARAR